jgi:hypothetical protein
MPLNIAAVQEEYNQFQQIMQLSNITCTQFNHHVWARRYNRPNSARLCEVIGNQWILFRRRGGIGFVAHVMTDAARAAIEQEADDTVPLTHIDQQFQHTEEVLTQAGMRRLRHNYVPRNPNQGYEFMLPIVLAVQNSAACYSIAGVSGYDRLNGRPVAHVVYLDCTNPMMFDSEVGFGTATSMADLADGLFRWLQ